MVNVEGLSLRAVAPPPLPCRLHDDCAGLERTTAAQ